MLLIGRDLKQTGEIKYRFILEITDVEYPSEHICESPIRSSDGQAYYIKFGDASRTVCYGTQ